jgi:hypothetical protein
MYGENEKQKAEIMHVGVLGMHWGHRKQSRDGRGTGLHGASNAVKRKFEAKSLAKNMDGRKTNKLLGKRNRKEVGKRMVDALMTPVWSKTKWSAMNKNQKGKTLAVTAVGVLAAVAISRL